LEIRINIRKQLIDRFHVKPGGLVRADPKANIICRLEARPPAASREISPEVNKKIPADLVFPLAKYCEAQIRWRSRRGFFGTGEARATSIPAAVCKERATKPVPKRTGGYVIGFTPTSTKGFWNKERFLAVLSRLFHAAQGGFT
jgi:hypothetical protein